MGMLIHRRRATDNKNKTKLEDVSPVEKKSKKDKDEKNEKSEK